MANTQYWVVGASIEGENRDKEFVEKGIWLLGWEKGHQFEKATNMQPGDRIAIKRLTGQTSEDVIKILHIGIIKGVIIEETNKVICTVDWVATNLDRDVSSKGHFKTVGVPFERGTQRWTENKEWLEQVFRI